jgi:hypothetical protein
MKDTLRTMPIYNMAQSFFSAVRKLMRQLPLLAVALFLFASARQAGAFSFIGPLEPWMSPVNGFNPLPGFDSMPAGPKQIGDEFRRNTPVMYWAADETFLDFFGSNGLYSIQQAFSAFNTVGKVSSYSLDLSEWPLESQRHNFTAQALNLIDIKSVMMGALMEQLGLVYPTRYMWVIHNRVHLNVPPPCPDGMDYLVVQRNFDPVPSPLGGYQASDYVNGVLYTYQIVEVCTSPVNPLADAVEFPVDSEANVFTAVADSYEGLDVGGFYLSLTRDDVGGMRYLFDTNNVNFETIPSQAIEFVTNDVPQLVFGSNVTLFAAQALTNNAAALQALYPGLIITSSSNFPVLVSVTNIVPVLVPGPPWAPAGTLQLAFTTNITQTVQLQFVHTFGNVASFQLVGTNWVLVPFTTLSQVSGQQIVNFQTISIVVTNPPFLPATNFTVVTNISNRFRIQTGPVGEFIIFNTNFCSLQILANVFTNVIPITNILSTGTNISGPINPGNTNASGSNTFNGQIIASQVSVISYFTNHAFYVLPVFCVNTNTGSNSFTLFQGIDGVSFVRHDFDSLLGRFFEPITNDYVMHEVTNGMIVARSIRRVITQPDFLINAADLVSGPAANPPNIGPFTRAPQPLNFNATAALGAAGPGTIESPSTITFNKGLPVFENETSFPANFLGENTQIFGEALGSFDGTTNPPVVYPDAATLSALVNQALMPISPNSLNAGNVGVPYSVQFSSLGGQAPLTFTLAPGSNPLPSGFTLASDGTLSGTPTVDGTFEFTVRLTDASSRVTDRLYTLVISP